GGANAFGAGLEEVGVLLEPRLDLGIGDGDTGVDLPGEGPLEEALAPEAIPQIRRAELLAGQKPVVGLPGILGAQAEHGPVEPRLPDPDAVADRRLLQELALDQPVEELPLTLLPPLRLVQRVGGDGRLRGEGSEKVLGPDRLA